MAAVCVYCSSSPGIEQKHLELATAVGERIAKDGHSLVSGGGRLSMMGALARAARAGGAHTLGVIPEHLLPLEVGDHESAELVVVQTMRERKRIMDDSSDAFIALPGGLGTLEELFEVWTSGYLGMHSKPVIVLDPDDFYAPLWAWVDQLHGQGFVRQVALQTLHRVTTVEAAFAVLSP